MQHTMVLDDFFLFHAEYTFNRYTSASEPADRERTCWTIQMHVTSLV